MLELPNKMLSAMLSAIVAMLAIYPTVVLALEFPCPIIQNVTCVCGRSDITCQDLSDVPDFLDTNKIWSGLYLPDQLITSIPSGTFFNLTVKKIVLDRNNLDLGLETRSFKEVSGSLRELQMSDCNLRALPHKILDDMVELRELHLSDNHLENLPDFSSTPQLSALIAWGNRIRRLSKESFEGLKNLERLDLDHNQLRQIHKELHALSALKSLQLGHNQITSLEPSPFKKQGKLRKLRRLSMNNNGLQFIPVNAFEGLKNLVVLDLHENFINILADSVFTGLGKLKLLNLDNNKIEFLWAGIFTGIKNLQEIHLSNNEIKQLPSGLFSGFLYLRHVFLDGNDFTSVGQCVFPERPVVVSAFRNQLECDCDLRYVVGRQDAALSLRGTCADHVTSVETLQYYEQCNTRPANCNLE